MTKIMSICQRCYELCHANQDRIKDTVTFRDEVFKLLNYIPDQSLVLWRGTQNLNTSNLLNYLKQNGVKSVCEVMLGMF